MDEELRKMLIQIMEGQEELKIDVNDIKKDVKKIGATIDGEVKPKIEALFDGYKSNTEHIKELGDKIDEININVNNLNIKSCSTDNKIIELNRKISVK